MIAEFNRTKVTLIHTYIHTGKANIKRVKSFYLAYIKKKNIFVPFNLGQNNNTHLICTQYLEKLESPLLNFLVNKSIVLPPMVVSFVKQPKMCYQ